MIAWLLDDGHPGMPLHKHTSRLRVIGRNAKGVLLHPKGNQTGFAGTVANDEIPDGTELTLGGQNTGVVVEGSFLDYVPRLAELYSQPAAFLKKPVPSFKDVLDTLHKRTTGIRKIIIPSGTIRARDFISWDWHGNAAANVAYMDTDFQGYGANEVVVEIDDDAASFKVTHPKGEESLSPYLKAGQYDEDIEPDTVELVISNLSPRREQPVFWGLHFWLLFAAAGYAPLPGHRNQNQFDAFEAVAKAYNGGGPWSSDFGMMDPMYKKPHWPFPFLTDLGPQLDATGVRADDKGAPTRGMLTGQLAPPGHDPVNTQICPYGRE
jgi:hypothetical protein